MKKSFIILVILFLSGIITADICIGGLQEDNIWMNLATFEEYATSKVAFKDVIWNMLYTRGKLMLCLMILGLTPWKEKMLAIFGCVFSFCFGFFAMRCIMELGFVGIVIAIASVFPHGLFYLGMFFVIYKRQSRYRHKIATYIFALLLFITGCVMECVMGVHFIPWVIRLSMI